MEEEIWKPVPGFENKYSVSSFGRVINIQRNKEIFASSSKTNPYKRFHLALGTTDKVWTIPVHRLVAMAFLPNPDNLPEVHHKDHDKENNKLSNLEWVTKSKNVREAIKAGKHHGGFKFGANHHSSKFTDKQILWVKKLKETGFSYSDLVEIFNSNRGYLHQVVNGQRRQILGENKEGFIINCKSFPVLSVCPQPVF